MHRPITNKIYDKNVKKKLMQGKPTPTMCTHKEHRNVVENFKINKLPRPPSDILSNPNYPAWTSPARTRTRQPDTTDTDHIESPLQELSLDRNVWRSMTDRII